MPEERRNYDELMGRVAQQVEDHERDIRAFGPMVRDVARLQILVETMQESITQCRVDIAEVKTMIEEDRNYRSRNRMLLWVALIGLVGTFLSSLAIVVGNI